MPFDLSSNSKEDEDVAFAIAVASLGGTAPSEEAVKLLRLYHRGDIDYETALFGIKRLHEK